MDKLLLVSCCAPCSVGVIADLAEQKKDFAVMFFNPNIKPESEYQRRLEENKRICDFYHIPFIEGDYLTDMWDKATKDLLNEPEKGKRCDVCFYLRLKVCADYAKQNGFTRMTSVLGISRFKDFNQVCQAGKKVEQETGLPYDTTNWRKNGGLEKSERLAKTHQLYRQTYCGCKPTK